jgi:mono/diheme cytochrome c family protein
MRTIRCVASTLLISLLVVLVVVYIFLRSEGLSARRKPSNFEYAIANYAMGLSIPPSIRTRTNTADITNERIARGRKVYSDTCAICHANDGTGKTQTANGLSPEVPDLHAGHIQKLTDGEMFYIIKNGVRFTGMPAWDLHDEQIWDLVLLIRQFGEDNARR